MTSYVLKRLLLMLPTTAAIALVMFVIMNAAPGRPGAELPGPSTAPGDAMDAARRESYRLFKHQFALDRPILFNARFLAGQADVRALLATILNADGGRSAREIIRATEALEDLGPYAVPPLMALLDDGDGGIRDLAVRALVMNAQSPLISPWELRRRGAEAAERNRAAARENEYLKTLIYDAADPAERAQAVRAAWREWYAARRDRFEHSGIEKLGIFFADTRFARYIANLCTLDFGISHVDKRPVLAKIAERLKYSVTLSLLSILIAYAISIPIGVFSAVKRNSAMDRVVAVILFMLYSLPSFFVGTALLYFLSQGSDYLRLFPTGGFQSDGWERLTTFDQIRDCLWHLALPLACLTYASFAGLSRYARSGLLEVLGADYVRTARAKGLPERVVIFKHALRNGLIPLLTLLAGLLPAVLGGSVIVEVIFNIPGMGQLMIDSIFQRDYNTVMGIGLLVAILVQVGILLSDISYALVDPRITFEGREAA